MESAVRELGRIHFKVLTNLNVCHFVLYRFRLLKGKTQNIYRIRGGVEYKERMKRDSE